MSSKAYYSTTGVIFLVIGVLHLLRVLNSWPVNIGTFVVPMWLSWAAVIVASYLSYQSLKKK
ncbi:MAG: hypothetical protein UW97_C0008G0021 [Parcubacteria group bacterium GW2011_GWA2_45_15]|nr:MAG: hypothetical protein UW97_C0008G0021 [Parcubacteria group bacterium GW2011_GWA2_45_15]